eukprot:1447168-Amphidinium_carterae.1
MLGLFLLYMQPSVQRGELAEKEIYTTARDLSLYGWFKAPPQYARDMRLAPTSACQRLHARVHSLIGLP